MAADGHLGMTALSRVTLASAGLSCNLITADLAMDEKQTKVVLLVIC